MTLTSFLAVDHLVVAARTDDIAAARVAAPDLVGEVLDLERGDYRWRIGVPEDGSMPAGGAFPTLIQWHGERHPAGSLPESGCRLTRLVVSGPKARARLARLRGWGLAKSSAVQLVESARTGILAQLRAPRGEVRLGNTEGGE